MAFDIASLQVSYLVQRNSFAYMVFDYEAKSQFGWSSKRIEKRLAYLGVIVPILDYQFTLPTNQQNIPYIIGLSQFVSYLLDAYLKTSVTSYAFSVLPLASPFVVNGSNIGGPAGAAGTAIVVQATIPVSAVGRPGDMVLYINAGDTVNSGNLYTNVAGVMTLTGSLRGPSGTAGASTQAPTIIPFTTATANPLTIGSWQAIYQGTYGSYPNIIVQELLSNGSYKDRTDIQPSRNYVAGVLDSLTFDFGIVPNGQVIIASAQIGASSAITANTYILPPYVNVMAFGDSNTVGYGGDGTFSSGYTAKAAGLLNTPVINYGINSAGVFPIAGSVFKRTASPYYKGNSLVTIMAGFNNARKSGLAAGAINKLKGSHRNMIASCFMDPRFSIPASDIPTLAGGPWGAVPINTYNDRATAMGGNGIIITTTTFGNLTFTFQGTNLVIGTYAYDGTFATANAFTVTVDGVLVGTYTSNGQTDGIGDYLAGNDRTVPSGYILYGFSNTAHTCVLDWGTVTAPSVAILDYVGVMKPPSQCAPVIVMGNQYMNAAGYLLAPASTASNAVMDAYNVALAAVVLEFSSQGYPVYYMQTKNYLNVATEIYTDNIHPNAAGYIDIASGLAATAGTMAVVQHTAWK